MEEAIFDEDITEKDYSEVGDEEEEVEEYNDFNENEDDQVF